MLNRARENGELTSMEGTGSVESVTGTGPAAEFGLEWLIMSFGEGGAMEIAFVQAALYPATTYRSIDSVLSPEVT